MLLILSVGSKARDRERSGMFSVASDSVVAVLGWLVATPAAVASATTVSYWVGERVGKPFGNGRLDVTDMRPCGR